MEYGNNQQPLINILIIPFKQVWQFVIFCLVFSSGLGLIFWPGFLNSFLYFITVTIWATTIVMSQWLGNVFIVHQLDKRISWIETPVKRAFIGIISLIFYSATAYILIQTLMYLIIEGSLPDNFGAWVLGSSKIAIFISFSIAFVFTSIDFLKSWQVSNLESEKLNAQMMTYKYESLRNQLNPHFLFNNFNVLSDLVYKDQELAVKFISQMSDLYRYVIDNGDKEVISLAEELTFIESYIFLLKTRFEKNLDIRLKLEAADDDLIVPMALQLLIENAVKHNEVSSAKPLTIEIIKKDDYILVTNNLQQKNVGNNSTKTGLRNITQRYAFMTNKKIDVKLTKNRFEVLVPILKSAE
jgi:two-component system LytT family sensor kinase